MGLLGASYALYTKAHLGIDIITTKVTGVKRQLVEIIIYAVIILFSLFVLVIGGFRLVDLTFTLNQISPSLGIPMGYVYLVLPLTGILMIYYSGFFIWLVLKKENLDSPANSASAVD
ncbi:MAG: TRAP transporter small permease subunit [Calditrichota bacterium]